MDFNHDYSEERRIIFHEGSWQIEAKKIWMIYNPVLRRWENEKIEKEIH